MREVKQVRWFDEWKTDEECPKPYRVDERTFEEKRLKPYGGKEIVSSRLSMDRRPHWADLVDE